MNKSLCILADTYIHTTRLVAVFYLETLIFGGCIFVELILWSSVSHIQIYRANKWVSAFTHLCRYIWVSSFSFGCFIVPHSSLAISEWASEPLLYNELNSAPVADPPLSLTSVLTLWESAEGGASEGERHACKEHLYHQFRTGHRKHR